MNNSSSAQESTMSSGLRAVLFIAAVFLCAAGLLALYAIVKLVLINYTPNYQIVSSRDIIYLILWGVVSGCFVAVGFSLFRAAKARLVYDVIPGPTLYILGVSLVIIGMFLITSGGMLPGTLMAVVGFFTMWLEFRSTFI